MRLVRVLTMRMGGLALAVVLALTAVGFLIRGAVTAPPRTEAIATPVQVAVKEVARPAQPAAAPTVAAVPGAGMAPPMAPGPPGMMPPGAGMMPPPPFAPPAPPMGWPAPPPAPAAAAKAPAATTTAMLDKPAKSGADRERVEADVSTRSVAVTSVFKGVEIVVFGSVLNSKSETAESGLYDVVVVVEGTAVPLVARKKSNVAGIWINTSAVQMESIPSYYAIASTRPLMEVAETHVLSKHGIGFDHMPMTPVPASIKNVADGEVSDFKKAVIRLKQKEGVYFASDYAVAFIGQALFRATISLPANVPVGPLSAKVHLFKEGEYLSSYTAKVKLEREGVERLLHSFAFDQPMLYGIFTVIIAVAAGLIASAMFRKAGAH